MPETTPPAYQPGGVVLPPGSTTEPAWQTAYRLRQRLAEAEHGRADAEVERDRLRAALKSAQEALIYMDPLCRYHGDTPPEHPSWHGGCDSCKQPTRVRKALDAIDAAQRATLDTQEEADRG